MGFAIQIIIQLIILVTAMVIAGLIMRWIMANPEKCKSAWSRTKRRTATPVVWVKATRAYINWKRVKMRFTFEECRNREWGNYDQKHSPDQEYYRL